MQQHGQDVEVLNDGGDTGPVEFQNNEFEDEMHDGVVHFGETFNVALKNAIHAATAVNTAVNEIRNTTNNASYITAGQLNCVAGQTTQPQNRATHHS